MVGGADEYFLLPIRVSPWSSLSGIIFAGYFAALSERLGVGRLCEPEYFVLCSDLFGRIFLIKWVSQKCLKLGFIWRRVMNNALWNLWINFLFLNLLPIGTPNRATKVGPSFILASRPFFFEIQGHITDGCCVLPYCFHFERFPCSQLAAPSENP